MNIKKTIGAISTIGIAFIMSTSPSFAVVSTQAQGAIIYDAYGLQRSASFNVKSNSNCTTAWDVTGNSTFTYYLSNDQSNTPYTHHVTLSQTGTSVTGDGGYPESGGDIYHWNIDSGSVTGDQITLSMTYDKGANGTVMDMTGTIDSTGGMSGTWTDNYGGSRAGTWTAPTGTAHLVYGGCTGSGNFAYSDKQGNAYVVKVMYVKASGNKVWFAGPVTAGNVGQNQWLFAEAIDNGPANLHTDQIWGSFTTQSAAVLGVQTMSNPGDGPFTVKTGNINVH